MKNTDILERAVNWNSRGNALRLRPAEWILLSRIDGERSVGDLVRECPLDLPFVMTTLHKFVRLDLARVAELTWEEFCAHQVSDQAQIVVTPAAETPAPSPGAAQPSAPEQPSEPLSGSVRFRLAPARATAPVREAEIAIPTLPLPRPPGSTAVESQVRQQSSGPDTHPLSLRRVLDFVMGTAGGGTRGQMAVYRTFLKVPVSQLQKSGIRSLDLNNTELQITDPALQNSILEAVRDVVGQPYEQ